VKSKSQHNINLIGGYNLDGTVNYIHVHYFLFRVVVSMNVNHTVDSAEPDDGTEEAPEMKSRPNFEIDIVKSNGKTLSFSCSFVPPPELSDVQAEQPTEGYGKPIYNSEL